ncbi:MAG: hypothetical protein QM802_25590 [Agriterribacter sp.]
MKKIIFALFILTGLVLNACNTATPENYFDQAVLNTNLFASFGTPQMARELKTPPAQMAPDNKTTVSVPRKEVVKTTIESIEGSLKKVKDLQPTDDTKEMLETSIALHELVLPVYKNEFAKLAEDYDKNLPQAELDAECQKIIDQYAPKFEQLYEKLTTLGKAYAAKNNINVNWGK